VCAGALGVACGTVGLPQTKPEYPNVQLPAHFAEGSGAKATQNGPRTDTAPTRAAESNRAAADAAEGSADAGGHSPTSEAAASSGGHGDLPDPPALTARRQWSFRIEYDRGTLRVGAPQFRCLPRPVATARRIGRYAFELWLGRELIERVRFELPLLAAEAPRSGPRRALREPPRFAPGARVSTAVQVPASDRANRARLLDRATGESIEVLWPPPLPAQGHEGCSEPAITPKMERGASVPPR
jgi:hypothetical protein